MVSESFVTFSASEGCLNLVGATVLVDGSDFVGIHHAGRALAEDFGRVTQGSASPFELVEEHSALGLNQAVAIIIGCIDSCRMIKALEASGKLDTSSIKGKWESFVTAVVNDPCEGCEKALVVVGSDKRGAIFGAYTLSGQIGVSP